MDRMADQSLDFLRLELSLSQSDQITPVFRVQKLFSTLLNVLNTEHVKISDHYLVDKSPNPDLLVATWCLAWSNRSSGPDHVGY